MPCKRREGGCRAAEGCCRLWEYPFTRDPAVCGAVSARISSGSAGPREEADWREAPMESGTPAAGSDGCSGLRPQISAMPAKLTGKVKWFNVKKGCKHPARPAAHRCAPLGAAAPAAGSRHAARPQMALSPPATARTTSSSTRPRSTRADPPRAAPRAAPRPPPPPPLPIPLPRADSPLRRQGGFPELEGGRGGGVHHLRQRRQVQGRRRYRPGRRLCPGRAAPHARSRPRPAPPRAPPPRIPAPCRRSVCVCM